MTQDIVKQPERVSGIRADTAAIGSDREPADRPSDAATEAIQMEQVGQMERVGVAAPDYASGVGAAQLVVKPVMAD
jgi:hypothetical protein